MKNALTPETLAAPVTVRAINFELEDSVRLAATDRAMHLLRHNPRIESVCIELENDPTRGDQEQFIAKGKVDFGGPALLASVTGTEAAATLDYLIDQLDHQLRKQRRLHRGSAAPNPA